METPGRPGVAAKKKSSQAQPRREQMKDITEAVMKHFGAPADAVIVQIAEAPKADKAGVAYAIASLPEARKKMARV